MDPASSPFSLEGKVILLTGGAGVYGKALSSALANTGCKLILASRNTEALELVARPHRDRGKEITVLPFDQGDESDILKLRDQIGERFGSLSGLVNNAALRPMSRLSDSADKWEQSMRVNGTGLFLMCRTFGELMAANGGGSIVNIGSIYGLMGPTMSFYDGTDMIAPPDYFFHKSGMLNLTRYFAAIHGRQGVRFNYIAAGGAFQNQVESFLRRYEDATFLGRMANPEELGSPVVFLLSQAASYITGSCLTVDGGFSSH